MTAVAAITLIVAVITALAVPMIIRNIAARLRCKDSPLPHAPIDISTRMRKLADETGDLQGTFDEFGRALSDARSTLDDYLQPAPEVLGERGFVRGQLFEFVTAFSMIDDNLEIYEIPANTTALFMGFDADGQMRMLVKGNVRNIPRSANVYLDRV